MLKGIFIIFSLLVFLGTNGYAIGGSGGGAIPEFGTEGIDEDAGGEVPIRTEIKCIKDENDARENQIRCKGLCYSYGQEYGNLTVYAAKNTKICRDAAMPIMCSCEWR